MTERHSVAKIDKLVKFIQLETVWCKRQENSLGNSSLGDPVRLPITVSRQDRQHTSGESDSQRYWQQIRWERRWGIPSWNRVCCIRQNSCRIHCSMSVVTRVSNKWIVNGALRFRSASLSHRVKLFFSFKEINLLRYILRLPRNNVSLRLHNSYILVWQAFHLSCY